MTDAGASASRRGHHATYRRDAHDYTGQVLPHTGAAVCCIGLSIP